MKFNFKNSRIVKPRLDLKCSLCKYTKGIEIGIPLNIYQNIFTYNHYGKDITTPGIVALQFLLGYYTYGKDRYKDALEYEKNPYETDKKDFYLNIIKNKNYYKDFYDSLDVLFFFFYLADKNFKQNTPFMMLLYSTNFYDEIKKNYGTLKPLYVSIMWTACTVILPCVLHDHNFSILNHPLDYLPCTLSLFANSNLQDNKDIEEDKINGIETLPVKYGINKSNMLSLAAIGLSSLLFGMSEHYLSRPIVNSLFELQNVGTAFLINNSTSVI